MAILRSQNNKTCKITYQEIGSYFHIVERTSSEFETLLDDYFGKETDSFAADTWAFMVTPDDTFPLFADSIHYILSGCAGGVMYVPLRP